MKFLEKIIFVFFLISITHGSYLVAITQAPSRDCLECGEGANVISATNFSLVQQVGQNQFENIDVSNCDNIDPNNIWLEFEYVANTDLENIFFISDLILTRNATGVERRFELDFMIGDLSRTPRGGGRNPPPPTFFRVQISLPPDFDCQNESLILDEIQLFWTPGQSVGNRDPECDDYNSGQCRGISNPQNIQVDGFIYDFDYEISCIREDGSIEVLFEITALGGGSRPYNIEWTFEIDGGEPIQVSDNFLVPFTFNVDLEEEQLPSSIKGSLVVSSANDNDVLDEELDPKTAFIPELFSSPLYTTSDNDPNEGPLPNGSITVLDWEIPENERDRFTFIWTNDLNEIVSPTDPSNPTFLTGLEEGIYRLTMIDSQTGLCRLFEFPISFEILPVIYSDLTLNLNFSTRTVNFTWSTTKEWEASHFEIERASQGINFEKVGEVKAAGWSDQLTEYVFEDKMLPLTGGNLLYRLKQVDFNGDYHYSEVLSVRIPGMEFTQGVWRAFPNPTDGNALQVSLLDASQYNEEPITFRLIHPMMQTPALTVDSETAMNEALSGGLSRMPKGVFVVEVQWGQKIEHIKVLKKY